VHKVSSTPINKSERMTHEILLGSNLFIAAIPHSIVTDGESWRQITTENSIKGQNIYAAKAVKVDSPFI
jgi:hypothetical protein